MGAEQSFTPSFNTSIYTGPKNMSASDEIKLWCWVLGDTCERVFPFIIESSAHIEDLKKAIKGKKLSFKDISADSIDLFKVGE